MPSVAHRNETGGLADVKLANIRVGDELTVLPCEICPVDGIRRARRDGRGVPYGRTVRNLEDAPVQW